MGRIYKPNTMLKFKLKSPGEIVFDFANLNELLQLAWVTLDERCSDSAGSCIEEPMEIVAILRLAASTLINLSDHIAEYEDGEGEGKNDQA